jgi:hypothetical protein
MLGHHPLLERELLKKGRRAVATVLQSKRTHYAETLGNASLVSDTRVLWKFVVRVEPEGEPSFEANIDELRPQTWSPIPGVRFPVLYDPEDRSKVVVDHSDEGIRLFEQELEKERVDARLARMRAKGQNVIADRYQQIHDAALGLFDSYSLSDNPDERKRQLAERRAKIKEIMGGQTAQDRMKLIREARARYEGDLEGYQEMLGEPTFLVGGEPVQPSPAAGAAATADALSKLADLRDRGVLTEEEFQAEKKKLLGA